MSAWWEQPYPLGPPVAVVGFPGPLYPPGAEGHKASEPGPDVIAYKRTVSRAGRWPWQAFDDAYSRAFALGMEGGNVSDSGVAGVQRQGGLDPGTGWLGQQTFELLRRIRIPEGLPHSGEPAMDANAQNLIAEAYGIVHPPPSHPSIRLAALELARHFIGYRETPRGSNLTTFGQWYGMNGQPWCAQFVTFCFVTCLPHGSTSFSQGHRYAYVPYIVQDAAAMKYGLRLTGAPRPGDLVCYDWDGGDYDHVGIFEQGSALTWQAIEGNTAIGQDSNGGAVMRRDRSRNEARRVAFVRVAE